MATKDTYYFKHDSNARNDIKLIKVRRKYKMEGYGIYFALLEILREQSDYKLPIADIADIAFDLSISTEKITSIINDFGLFNVENGCFYSESFMRRMESYNDLKAKRVAAAIKGGQASVKQRSTKRQPKVKQPSTDGQPLDYTILDYTKVDYTRVEKTKEYTLGAFEAFWKMYGKPTDKKKCFDKFDRLELIDWNNIFLSLPDYVNQTPNIQYRKNPLTYLNGRCWEDELATAPTGAAKIHGRDFFDTEQEYFDYCKGKNIIPQ